MFSSSQVAFLPEHSWIFVITEVPNFIWLCSHTCLHLFWHLHVKEKILGERAQNQRSLYLHPFPAKSVTGQAWLSSALALRLWPCLASASLFPAGLPSHIENFPWWGPAWRNGLPFLLCAARARRTSDPSFLPNNCFSSLNSGQKLFRADNSSAASFPPTPCECSSRLVQVPPGCHMPSGALRK